MRFPRTTISCVGVAIFILLCSPAHSSGPVTPELTFPLQLGWMVTFDAAPNFPPAFDPHFAYLALRNDHLVAVSLKEGITAWSVECPTTAPPAAGDGLVFVSNEGFIEARSQEDGGTQWRRQVPDRITSLYWDTGWLLAASEKGPLLALRAIDGELLWQRDFGAGLRALPAAAGERLYLALKDGRLIAASLNTGQEIWTRKLSEPAVGLLAVADRLYAGSLDNYFYCLDSKDGDVDWRWRTGADIVGVPVIDTKRVYFVALDNVLRAHDRNSGSMLWKKVLPMRPSTGPLMSGSTLIVAGIATELRAYAAIDGRPRGDFALKSSLGQEVTLAAPPYLTTLGLLIITTREGQLQALTSGTPPAP